VARSSDGNIVKALGQQHFTVCSLIADATAIPWALQLVLEENRLKETQS